MPVRGVERGERPDQAVTRQSLLHVEILGDVLAIVVDADELILEHRLVSEDGHRNQASGDNDANALVSRLQHALGASGPTDSVLARLLHYSRRAPGVQIP